MKIFLINLILFILSFLAALLFIYLFDGKIDFKGASVAAIISFIAMFFIRRAQMQKEIKEKPHS
jgi:Na+-driven multidrug efflux pump